MTRFHICRRLAAVVALSLIAPAPCAIAQCLLPLPLPQYMVQGAPRKVATGDLNGDGIADIVTTQDGRTDAAVLLSAGGGAFHPAVYLPVGGTAYGVAIANLDGVGGLDLVIAVSSQPTVAIFTNDGAGNFTAGADLVTASGQRDVAAADVNGDGLDDIAYIGINDETIYVWENDGAGGFDFWASATFAYGPFALALGDQDGDGFAELAVVEAQGHNPLYGPGSVSYYANLGESAGQWQGLNPFPSITLTDPYPSHVRFDDVDGLPGKEIIVSCDGFASDEGYVNVLTNPVGGVFQSVDSYHIGTRAPWSVVGDLNGDGLADIAAVSDISSDRVSILISNGDGTFAPPVDYDYPGNHLFISIELSDLDGDGDLDCVMGGISGRTVCALINNGDGTFDSLDSVPTGESPNAVALADFNLDGVLDMVVASNGSGGVTNLHIGNGDGTFQSPITVPSIAHVGFGEPVNLNGDAWPDLIATDGTILTPHYNDTVGGFTPGTPTPAIPGLSSVSGVAVADLNGDTHPDLAVTFNATAHPWNRLRVILSDGVGGWALGDARNLGFNAANVHARDVDGDSDLDLITLRPYIADGVTVLYNNGAGVFASQTDFPSYNPPINSAASISMVTADLDGDTDIDIAIVNSFALSVSVLLNNGSGVYATQPPIDIGVRLFGIDAADITGDGILDLVIGVNQGAGIDVQSMYGVTLLPGQGAGAYGDPIHFAGSDGPWDVVCGDVNDDGRPDVLATGLSAGAVDVLLNNGCLAAPPFCPGDSNGDSMVNFDDITETLANWQVDYSPGTGPGDANADGLVNFDDITEVLANWGASCK